MVGGQVVLVNGDLGAKRRYPMQQYRDLHFRGKITKPLSQLVVDLPTPRRRAMFGGRLDFDNEDRRCFCVYDQEDDEVNRLPRCDEKRLRDDFGHCIDREPSIE